MSLSVERTISVHATKTACIEAGKAAINNTRACVVDSVSENTGMIEAHKKIDGRSGYGERITFLFRQKDTACDITVSVSPKVPYLLWRTHCEKTSNELLASLDIEIKNQEEFISPAKADESSSSSADEIRSFKALLDDGIITQEEFDAKKKQLLGI